MALSIPTGQPISFDSRTCNDSCVLLRNPSICDNPYIVNPNFLGNLDSVWTFTNGTLNSINPAIVAVAVSPVFTISQDITITDGEYTVYWSFTQSTSGLLSVDLAINTGLVSTNIIAQTDAYIQGSMDITVSSSGAPDTLSLAFTPSGTKTLQLNYFYICKKSDYTFQTDFCVQLPLEQTGSELLQITDEEISFPVDWLYGPDSTSVSSGTAVGAGTKELQVTASVGSPTQGQGLYFGVYNMLDINVAFGLDPVTAVPNRMDIILQDAAGGLGTPEDFISVSASDSNTSILSLGTNVWLGDGSEVVDLNYRTDYEFDSDDSTWKWNWNTSTDDVAQIASFRQQTFTAADDTFYRLSFRLAKTSSCTVRIIDSNAVPIYVASSTGVIFNNIFKTGTLPTATLTVRWEITYLDEFPNTDYNVAVLTEVQVYKMCDYTLQLVSGVSAPFFTENHEFIIESAGNTYNRNIEYCIDTQTITKFAEYQAVATNKCDATKILYGNSYDFCASTCGLSEISWTRTNIICVGNEVLDYTIYPATEFFWIKASLQDLTIEEEKVFYRGSDNFWNVPYALNNTVEVLQVWALPGYMRKALAVAMAGVFKINGIEYQKINDDDYVPQFNAVLEAPLRILVAKVGDNMVSRNL